MNEHESKALLAARGLLRPRHVFVEDANARIEPPFAGPYVVKAVSDQLAHKSELGLVRLGVRDPDEIASVIAAMRTTATEHGVELVGFLVEETIDGVELAIGVVDDPCFGLMIMIATGGTLIELFDDTAFRIAPVDEHDAREMLHELRGRELLAGHRGREVVPEQIVVDTILAVAGASGLVSSDLNVVEMDINPLILNRSGAYVADAVIMVRDDEAVCGAR